MTYCAHYGHAQCEQASCVDVYRTPIYLQTYGVGRAFLWEPYRPSYATTALMRALVGMWCTPRGDKWYAPEVGRISLRCQAASEYPQQKPCRS